LGFAGGGQKHQKTPPESPPRGVKRPKTTEYHDPKSMAKTHLGVGGEQSGDAKNDNRLASKKHEKIVPFAILGVDIIQNGGGGGFRGVFDPF